MNGLIIRSNKLKDSDAIIDWLTDDDRIITTYAAHIQTNKAYPNGLELMNIYELEIVERPNQEFARMTSALCAERFDNIMNDIQSYACACAAIEMTANVCPKDAVIPDVFSSLLSTFAVMNTAHELSTTVLAWFECFVLYQLGAMPNLEMCAKCAKPLQKSEWFQQELGFLCADCAIKQTNIPAFVLEAIRRLRYQTIRTTVQNALTRNDEMQRKRILAPVLKFLAAVMCDNSPYKTLKAHRYMAETALGMELF